MSDPHAIEQLFTSTVYDETGSKVGAVSQVYTDDRTQQPSWVSVNTGFFGSNETLVPLAKATVAGSEIRVPYSKSFIKDAPNQAADKHLDPDAERRLYEYYGQDYTNADPTMTDHAPAYPQPEDPSAPRPDAEPDPGFGAPAEPAQSPIESAPPAAGQWSEPERRSDDPRDYAASAGAEQDWQQTPQQPPTHDQQGPSAPQQQPYPSQQHPSPPQH